jgi:beta-glucosidase/6-phospho-beta-glucosidase/beta-galactosidase
MFGRDLPQTLEDKYGGWVNGEIVDDFAAYARVGRGRMEGRLCAPFQVVQAYNTKTASNLEHAG